MMGIKEENFCDCIPIDKVAISSMAPSSVSTDNPNNLAYLSAAAKPLATWAFEPEHLGAGLGLLVPSGTFPETPQARYSRMAKELYTKYGPDTTVQELQSDKQAIFNTLGLKNYCPKGKDPAHWCEERFAGICKQYKALQEENAAKLSRAKSKASALRAELSEEGSNPDPDILAAVQRLEAKCSQNTFYHPTKQAPLYQTKMLRASAVQKKLFDKPFYLGKENQFLCLNGFLGHGREYHPSLSGSKWNPCSCLWRDANHCGCLHACYVDLDCYKCGFTQPEQVAAYYKEYIDGIWLPQCSAILISGYGCYIIWFFGATDLEENGWQLLDIHTTVEKYLAYMLSRLGADPAATDVARVLRIPGSIHHKDGKAPKPVYVWHLAPPVNVADTDTPCYEYKDALAFFRALEPYTGQDFGLDRTLPQLEQRKRPIKDSPLFSASDACGAETGTLEKSQMSQNNCSAIVAKEKARDKAAYDAEPLDASAVPAALAKKPFVWNFHVEPELLPGEPVPISSIRFLPGCPRQYFLLTQATAYAYQHGRNTPSLSIRQAHDMTILLLYFENGIDYISRHVAIFWLVQFLRNAQTEQKAHLGTPLDDSAIQRFVGAVCHQMQDPLPGSEVQYILSQPDKHLHVKSNRLITKIGISPRSQPYMQAILYEAEAKRRAVLRQKGYELYRSRRMKTINKKAAPSRHRQAVIGRAERRSDAAQKVAEALFAFAMGCSEREAAARSGITKGKASRLHRAYKETKEVIQSNRFQDAPLVTYLSQTASANGLCGATYVQAAAIAAKRYNTYLEKLQRSIDAAQQEVCGKQAEEAQSLSAKLENEEYVKQCQQDCSAAQAAYAISPRQCANQFWHSDKYLSDAYAMQEIYEDFWQMASKETKAAETELGKISEQMEWLANSASFFKKLSPT